MTHKLFDTLYASDEFFEGIIDYGNAQRKAWFLKWGRENLNKSGANAVLYKYLMNNIFGWSDKPSDKHGEKTDDLKNYSNDELEKLVREEIRRAKGKIQSSLN